MKKLITFFFLLFIFNNSYSQSVSVNEAKTFAYNYYYAFSNPKPNIDLNENFFSEIFVISEDNDTLYYVFNIHQSKGFVILSADKRAYPIIGYSLKGSYSEENQPPAFKSWMLNRKNEIAFIKKNHLAEDYSITQKWNNLSNPQLTNSIIVNPLIQTQWGQGCNYNLYCPIDIGSPAGYCGRAPTGCVATTMGQIMKYWNFPFHGSNSTSYTPSNYLAQTLSANFSDSTYLWDGMNNNVANYHTEISKLLYNCGVAVHMEYDSTESISYADSAFSALKYYFRYSNDAMIIDKNTMSDYDWSNILKNELDNNRPIFYKATDNIHGGHAFICDGYNSNGEFHINWGWDGYQDDYFYIGNLNPSIQNQLFSNFNFNYYQTIITNLHPVITINTLSAVNITYNSAALRANAYTYLDPTVIEFEYGLTSNYTNTVAAGMGPISLKNTQLVTTIVNNLSPLTTYHFRVKATSPNGVIYGDDKIFTTLPDPNSINLSLGLVAYYSFNGDVNDESGNGNNGIVHGAIPTTDRFGNANSAYSFDGNGSYINTLNNINIYNNQERTISCWFLWKINNNSLNPAMHDIIGWGNTCQEKNYQFLQISPIYGIVAHFHGGSNDIYNPLSIIDTLTWHHLVYTHNNTTSKIYIDGILINQKDIMLNTVNTNLLIGYTNLFNCATTEYNCCWNTSFMGKVDDISIYNRAISQIEIDSLYHKGGWPLQTNLSTGLVAYYPFNGNVNDESGNGNNGVLHGATPASDRFGNTNSAYSFDGISNYIDIASNASIDINENITISAWIYITDYNYSRDIVGKTYTPYSSVEPYSLYVNTSGNLVIFTNNSIGLGSFRISNSMVPLNQWVYVAGTISNNNYRLFINGVDAGMSSESINHNFDGTNSYSLKIGKFRTNNYFKGKIDDIRLYNRSLSQTLIDSLYHEGGWPFQTNFNTGLVAYYPFNNNAYDESGNGHNGEVNGAIPTLDRFQNVNRAYSFNGTNNSIGTNLDISYADFTISLWVYNYQHQYSQIIDCRDVNSSVPLVHMYVSNDDKIKYGIRDNSGHYIEISSITTIDNNKWYNIVVDFHSGVLSVYINGTKENSAIYTYSYYSSFTINRLVIGGNYYDSGSKYNGKIDDIRIFNRALNVTEIDSLFHIDGWPLQINLNTGLVAHYPFNGNAHDESGNGNNGLVAGATTTFDRFGNANSAYSFDGSSNKITIPHKSILNAFPLTLNSWIKTSSTWGAIITKYTGGSYNGWSLHVNWARLSSYYYSNNGANIWGDGWTNQGGANISNGGWTNSILINDDKWHMVTAVYDYSGVKLFCDNQLILETSFTNGIPNSCTTNQDVYFGNNMDNYYPFYSGKIDDTRIYNRALNTLEIDSLYHIGGWPLQPILNAVYDIDGNGYDTVNIGTQTWLKQNLKTTHYRNGNAIPNVTDNTVWSNLTTGAYCNFDNDSTNSITYGKLYNYFAVSDNRNLCPTGWHVNSENELNTLINYLGGNGIAGGKLKETGFLHWPSPNNGATNESGFTALGGGNRHGNGYFYSINSDGNWWISNSNGLNSSLSSCCNNITIGSRVYQSGVSVRCIKDVIQQTNLTYPKITLNSASIVAGQNIIINGTDFKPNGTAKITIQGPAGFSESINNISTNAQGKFSYTYTTISTLPIGNYNIQVTDAVSGLSCQTAPFILSGQSIPNNLQITYPTSNLSFKTNQSINVEWKDKLVKGNSYILSGSKRMYKYIIEYSDNNGPWQNIGNIQGLDNIDKNITLNKSFIIGTVSSNIKVRISDFYNSANVKMSPAFSIAAALATNIHVNYNWDTSYPTPNSFSFPQGIAADGTARIYLNLSKINPSISTNIISVTVSLSDGYNGTDYTKLGRVVPATQTKVYSSEANGINTISATFNKTDTNYIFWYVAPDDFVGNNTQDSIESFRNVDATFNITYADMSTETLTTQIKIVRPPLMLVHGLGGDESTWDNFSNTAFGYKHKFTNHEDLRFKYVKAVNITPNASFKTNALNMTIGNINSDPNTFQGIITEMRNQGYASNRVDYICHSMGGCVLRSIFDNWNAMFTRTGNYTNHPFKNYEKGYVNKVIMIDVPNNGSPWADIINRYVRDLPWLVRSTIMGWYAKSKQEIPLPLVFIKPVNPNDFIWTYQPTDAVNNLQIDQNKGGIKFSLTNTKAHLISGDFFPGNQSTNIAIPQSVINFVKNCGDETLDKFLNYLLKIGANKEPNPNLKATLLDILKSDVDPVSKALDFLNKVAMAMDAVNTVTFLPESDLVVSVESQLAGYPRPISNSDSNVSIFDNYVGHTFIRSVVDNIDVGNRVNYLLNSSINSPLFNVIPATPANGQHSMNIASLSNISSGSSSLNTNQIISKTDTTKLQIISPQNNEPYYVDSVLHIVINVQDTANLMSLEVNFQNKTYYIDSLIIGTIDLNVQVNPNLLDTQKILLEGFYNYPDSGVFVYDQVNLNIVSNEQLTEFGVNPDILYLFKNQIKNPDYYAIYQSYATTTSNFSPNITAVVEDTTIVKYDLIARGFKGISNGETSAIITYSGLSDTIYFIVGGCMSGNIANVTANKPTTICVGENITLTAEPNQLYSWSTGDSSQSINVSNAGTYSLVATDTNGCVSVSPTYTIIVNPLPTIPTIAVIGNTIFCQGDSVILKSDTAYSYKWTTNDSTQNIVIRNSGDYSVTISDTNGCSATSTIKTITVNPLPDPIGNISGIDTISLYQSPISYSIDTVPNTLSYSWTLPYGMTGLSDSNRIIVNYGSNVQSGNITVKGHNACGDGPSSSLAITVFPSPQSSVFTASVSNAWENGANWDHGVPGPITNATILSSKLAIVNSRNYQTKNLIIEPLAKLTINTDKDLTVNDTLTLQSDASGTASLIDNGTLHTTTNIVERFIPHTFTDEFHMLASPVFNQPIIPVFNQTDGFYLWNETTGNWIEYANAANFATANSGTNFVPGKGYAISYPAVITKSFTGNLNTGTLNIPLTYSAGLYSGWNFIANPYPSSINWNATNGWTRNVLADAGNNEKAMWIWNPAVANYGAYISNEALGTNNVSRTIPSAQGFWVKAIQSGNLSMTNEIREHSDQLFLKSTTSIPDILRLSVNGTANSYSDELIIKFGNTNDLGGAEKMFSIDASAPSLYCTKLNKNWSINMLTSVADHAAIPVGFKAGVNGIYTISVSDLNSFTSTTYTYLKDLKTNTLTDLNQNATYTFTAITNDNANRFQLMFAASPLSISNTVLQNTSIYAYDNSIYINSDETVQQISIYNTLGQLIKTVGYTNGKIIISMKNYSAAYYIVRVVTTKNVYLEKVFVN
ncbi:MAG: LamG-like jellyroll fold domain-containing protein [Bacteroidales bacterium]